MKRSSFLLTFLVLSTVASCSASGTTGRGGPADGSARLDGAGGTLDGGRPASDAGRVEICNGLDDDGDGMVDEECGCMIGSTQPCWAGDPALAGVGTCMPGTQECFDVGAEFGHWRACTGETPPGAEACDGIDNDCDGTVDDGCDCTLGATRPCYGGPASTDGVGECAPGTQSCEAGAAGVGSGWGACTGEHLPSTEACNGLDDDCTGAADEGCACVPGESRTCYGGPAGTAGVGVCTSGMQVCMGGADGSPAWGTCVDAVLPSLEICDGIDNDCDGTVDNGCLCPPGATRACYDSDPATRHVGACLDGMQTCELGPMGVGSDWGACMGDRGPSAELCNGTDDDCDTMLDEGCTCTPGTMRACYSGAPGTSGVGVCRGGMQSCVLATDGTASWDTCVGEVTPGAEVCFDGTDGDCDGTVDDGCNCGAGTMRACYSGTAATRGVGACRDGSQSCVIGAGGVGSDYGMCSGDTLPATEICNDVDDDCDGTIDEGCICRSGDMRTCYTGPPGTSGVGICRTGTQSCVVGGGVASWGTCTGQTLPAAESCDGIDNDCNGTIDNGCACLMGDMRSCYSGPAGTAGVGICRAGTQSCVVSGGTASWGMCTGEVLPRAETCNTMDDNCNGLVDDGGICGSRCYTGPARILVYAPGGTTGTSLMTPGTAVVTVASEAMWSAMTTADFGNYDIIWLDGVGTCSGTADVIYGTAQDTVATWGPAVRGRIELLIGDPDYHGGVPAQRFYTNSANWLKTNGRNADGGRTSLFINWGCAVFGSNAAGMPPGSRGYPERFSAVLGAPISTDTTNFCSATTSAAGAGHPVLAGLPPYWDCPLHGGFSTIPAGYTVITYGAGTSGNGIIVRDTTPCTP